MNLLISFVHTAEVGHKSILNLSFKDNAAKLGFKHSIFLKRQFLSAVNIVHWTKKCSSVSGGAAGGAGGACVGLPGGGGRVGGPRQQYWQVLWSTGVIGLV